jgi:hypothetical protein
MEGIERLLGFRLDPGVERLLGFRLDPVVV